MKSSIALRRARELDALAALDARPERLVALGLAYARAGRTDRAVVALGTAVERFPESAAAYIALGRVWLQSAEESRTASLSGRRSKRWKERSTPAPANSEVLGLLGRALSERTRGARGTDHRGRRDRLPSIRTSSSISQMPPNGSAMRHRSSGAGQLQDTAHEDRGRRSLPRRVRRASRICPCAPATRRKQSSGFGARRAKPPDAALLGRLADLEWRTGDVAAARRTIARALDVCARRHPRLLAVAERVK